MLTERQLEIIKILYTSNGYIAINTIAAQINFSPKTVRNDIAEIKEYIEQNKFGTLVSKPKMGTSLQISSEAWEKLQSVHNAAKRSVGSPVARKYIICETLLKKKSTTIMELGKQLFLSRDGVEKALGEARELLQKEGISLQITRGKGIKVNCTEFQRRLALLDLFVIMQKMASLNETVADERSFAAYKLQTINEISSFLDGFNAINVIAAVQETENLFGIQFEYASQKQLIFLLSLVLVCCKSKMVIREPFLKNVSKFNQIIAEDLADRLERKCQIFIPKEERDYVIFCVSISELRTITNLNSRLACEQSQFEFCGFIAKLINIISKILGVNLTKDKLLAQNLFLYLRSALERLRYGIRVNNPFLAKIKAEYPNIFTVAWTVSILLEDDTGIKIGENEIGFLTLYIGGAIERANFKTKVCILCNYRIGISQLLRQRIERSIPNIAVLETVTAHDTQKIIKSGCDFIITTQNIGSTFCGKDVVVVDNFLLPYDIKVIEQKAFEIRKRKMRHISKEKLFKKYVLFNSSFIRILDKEQNKDALLRDMCLQLVREGYVTKDFLNSVMERETVTSTDIGKQVAIPHGSTKFVIKPIISVAILKKPVAWNETETVNLIFLLALKQDSMLYMKDQLVKFYSMLVTLTEDDAKLKYAKNIHDKKQFACYMNQLIEEEGQNETK